MNIGATLVIWTCTLVAPILTQYAITDHTLGARIPRGRCRHTRSYSKDSCETGVCASRSPPAIHWNFLFWIMSVVRLMGPEVFLLFRIMRFLFWFVWSFWAAGEPHSLFHPMLSYLYCLSCFFVFPHTNCSINGSGCQSASEFPLSTYIFLLSKFLTLLSLSENAI